MDRDERRALIEAIELERNLLAALREQVPRRYPNLDTPDYSSIIDARSFERLVAMLETSSALGGALSISGATNQSHYP